MAPAWSTLWQVIKIIIIEKILNLSYNIGITNAWSNGFPMILISGASDINQDGKGKIINKRNYI